MTKVGSRIGAVRDANKDKVFLYGYGTYVGDECPPVAPFGLRWDTNDVNMMKLKETYTNPKLVLDNGKVAWGLQCWWGPEEAIKKFIGQREVVIVDPEEDIQNA